MASLPYVKELRRHAALLNHFSGAMDAQEADLAVEMAAKWDHRADVIDEAIRHLNPWICLARETAGDARCYAEDGLADAARRKAEASYRAGRKAARLAARRVRAQDARGC